MTEPAAPAASTVTFRFEDRTVTAAPGQSIAAALYADGVRIFSRSFKYHRPRGLLCVAGECPNCLMQVDGRPNVRTCVEPAREGQVVQPQNVWPSLSFDVLRVFDYLDRFLPVGFYYKRFHKPRWLWPLFEHVVRHIAGLGVIDVNATPALDVEVEHLHTDVCVIGGGPAGLAAADSAAQAGAGVLLLERLPQLGGHLLYRGSSGPEETDALRGRLGTRVRVLLETTAFGLYEGNLVGAFRHDRLLKIRARQVIVCTGARQRPFVFHKNDLPGILLGDGALRLAHLHGVSPGRRAVVVADDSSGHHLPRELARLGIEVSAVVDASAYTPIEPTPWALLTGHVVVEAVGGRQVKGVRVAPLDTNGDIRTGEVQYIPCDLVCMAPRRVPANELLLQGGMRFHIQGGQWLPQNDVPGLAAAGGAAGVLDRSGQSLQGLLRGGEAAAALGYPVPELAMYRHDWEAWAARETLAARIIAFPQRDRNDRKRFICLCEDVTEKDLEQAVAEGFDNVETLKRYSTVGMGPCQGKVCGLTATEVCARLTGRDLNATGTTTSRPPAVPVELGILAADRRHQPVRRTPLHHWHEAAAAVWLDAGLWKRPESYGDVAAEVGAVRTAVGLIDVSTLGKIELIGPDAEELLDRVYLNRWSDLKLGRVRYGAMCTEEGILFDDGVGARLGPEHFYLTATTGNAEAVFQWLELWRVTWGLDVQIYHRTSALAAVNLAGPRARDVLAGLAALDVSAAAFPYMTVRAAEVAGVACRLLRLGFVGELSYEIHCPAAQAWHLWEALCNAGKPWGLRPFGVEAQRILRLEKGHVIIGQDTDALSTPLDAGLGGLVRFDKPLFHGREPLLRLRAFQSRTRLVGFTMADGGRLPAEGCQVVEDGAPAGRVTSIRHSPTFARALGLAWVPAERSQPGSRFFVRHGGVDLEAVVMELPFYDPEGRRLRS